MTYYLSLILYCFLLLIAFVYGNNDKQTRNNKLSKRYVRYLGFILAIEFLRLLSIYVLDIKIANYLFPFYIAGEFFLVLSFFQVGLKKERKSFGFGKNFTSTSHQNRCIMNETKPFIV